MRSGRILPQIPRVLTLTPQPTDLDRYELASRGELPPGNANGWHGHCGTPTRTCRIIAADAAHVHPDDFKNLDDLAKFPFTQGRFAGEPPVRQFTAREQIPSARKNDRQITVVGYTKEISIPERCGRPLTAGGKPCGSAAPRQDCSPAFGRTMVLSGEGDWVSEATTVSSTHCDFKPDVIMVTPSYMLSILMNSGNKASIHASRPADRIFGAEP